MLPLSLCFSCHPAASASPNTVASERCSPSAIFLRVSILGFRFNSTRFTVSLFTPT